MWDIMNPTPHTHTKLLTRSSWSAAVAVVGPLCLFGNVQYEDVFIYIREFPASQPRTSFATDK